MHDTVMELVATHRIQAFEGDIEYRDDPETGLAVPANPLVYDSGAVKNMILTAGKTAYLERLAGLSGVNPFIYVGVGTDSTAAAATQTQLNPTVAGTVLVQACDATFPSVSGTVLTYQSTFGTSVANFSWNEAGIFNGETNGTSTLFNRVVIGPFQKSSAVSIVYTSTITQS